MRIGVVTTSYPRAHDDAAGCFVASHVDWLRRRGHEVEVICAADARPHQPWQPGVSVSPVPASPGLFYAGGAPDALARTPAALWGAARFAAALSARVARRAHRWELCVAHWLVPSAVAAALAPSRARLLAIAHSGDVHLAHRLGLMSPLALLLATRRARLVFVNHALRARFLAGARPGPVHRYLERASMVSPMGVDVARFRALKSATAVPGQPPTVLFLVRLVPIKGAAVLALAARFLPADTRVIIAGDGPERPALERAVAAATSGIGGQPGSHARIELAGEVRGGERDRLLAAADVLVVPSVPVEAGRSEGAPVTVLEAMAAGVPVVASCTGGLAALPGTAVTLVRPGDPAELAAAIIRCAAAGPYRQRQVATARRLVESLDWERVGSALMAAATSRHVHEILHESTSPCCE